MRLTIKTFGLTLFASAAFISCSREVIPEIETPEEKPVEKPTTHTIRIKADGQDTRTQIVGTSSLWSEGDRLMVYQGYGYGKDGWNGEKKKSEEGSMANGGRQMDFQVDFDYVDPEDVSSNWNDDEEFKFLYRAVYPAENVQDYGNYMVVTLPDVQHPTKTSFDPKADILTSRPTFLMEQPDELSLAFKRQTALGQMTLKGLPEGARVYTVVFYPSASVVKEFRMNVFNEEGDVWGETCFENGIIMQMPGWEVPAAGSSGMTEVLTSFMTCPLSLGEGDGFAVEIVTKEMVENDKTGESYEQLFGYVKVVEFGEGSGKELVFTAGDATIFAVNMTGIEPMEIPSFELTFDEYTEEDFPNINDVEDRYIEIPYMVAGESSGGTGGDGPIKVRRASKVAAGQQVWISFNVNHPWTVSFSESWLSAIDLYSSSSYGEFRIDAEMNLTGEPREATMTIASQIYGEVTVRVVQEAMVLSDFELTFDEYTEADFPHINDENDPYIEIPFMVAGGSGGEDPKKVNTRASNVAAGQTVWISFNVNHPWTVSFSEPWLSASTSSGNPGYGEFKVYAETNITGEPREATMTISSLVEGEVTVRVVQEELVLPTGITISAPETVTPYSFFDVEASLIYPEGKDGGFTPNIDVINGSDYVKWESSTSLFALSPGKTYFQAYFEYGDYTLESDPVEVTIAEPTAPTDWYFLVKRDNKPYLIHRNGGSDTDIKLSDYELAQAHDLALSADGKVYVAGANPDTDHDNVLRPCLWTVDGASVTRTDLVPSSGSAEKVVLEGGDIYVLANTSVNYQPKYVVLKNNSVDWTAPVYEEIFDITVDNGHIYLCGASQFENWADGNYAKLWIDGVSKTLKTFVDSDLDDQRYYPQRVAVSGDDVFVTGYLVARDRYSHDHAVACRWEGDYSGFAHRSRADWWWTCLYDMALFEGGHRIYVGESFYNSSTNRRQEPMLYYDYITTYLGGSNCLSLTYSGDEAGLNQVRMCNGIPILLGTVDGSSAFWEAPWKEPMIWNNDDDEMIGFVVK